jgi:hypothetical protein
LKIIAADVAFDGDGHAYHENVGEHDVGWAMTAVRTPPLAQSAACENYDSLCCLSDAASCWPDGDGFLFRSTTMMSLMSLMMTLRSRSKLDGSTEASCLPNPASSFPAALLDRATACCGADALKGEDA